MAKDYDLIVLGGGTGGYVAAIRASQLGMKVAVVEKDKLGGTCLHRGCIPSKALLRSASLLHWVREAENLGIYPGEVTFDFRKMQEKKEEIVTRLYRGVTYLLKKNRIDVFQGTGSIASSQPLSLVVEQAQEGQLVLTGKNLLIATGARPRSLPNFPIDGEYLITSDEILTLEKLPDTLLIVGGGVIGIEWASMLSDLGVKITIVEAANRILPGEDLDISHEMERQLQARGVEIFTGAEVLPDYYQENLQIIFKIKNNKGQIAQRAVNKILLSVGRVANTEGIGLENTTIEKANGFIQVNEVYETKEKNIYAIGDVIGGMQLAHVAAGEGRIAVEHMAGRKPLPMDYGMIPRCVYGRPEVASVGLTETEAKELGYQIKVGKVPFMAIGKALINGDSEGFCKIIEDKQTKDLLGMHLIGSGVTELISEGVLARTLDATAGELASMIHPHPSLSEIFGETALDIDKIGIHF